MSLISLYLFIAFNNSDCKKFIWAPSLDYRKILKKLIVSPNKYGLRDYIVLIDITKNLIMSYAKILSQWSVLISSATHLVQFEAQQVGMIQFD